MPTQMKERMKKYTRKPTDEEIEELRKSYENMRRNREKL